MGFYELGVLSIGFFFLDATLSFFLFENLSGSSTSWVCKA